MANTDWVDALVVSEEEQLRHRIEYAPADATIRGMFVQHALETVRRLSSEADVASIGEQLGLDLQKVRTMTKVPLKQFNELRLAAIDPLMRKISNSAEAMEKIGGGAVEIFFESVAGRTMKLLAGNDPHRLMSAAPNGYDLVVSDGATRVYTRVSNHEGHFAFTGDYVGPCHQIGVFSRAISETCGIDVQIALEQSTVTDFVLRVTW